MPRLLQRIALLAIAAPRRILIGALLLMVGCGVFGVPVAQYPSAGGFQDPTSESDGATALLVDKFGQGDMELLISKDGKTGLIVAGITGGESGAQKHAKELTDELVGDRDRVTVRAGGVAMT